MKRSRRTQIHGKKRNIRSFVYGAVGVGVVLAAVVGPLAEGNALSLQGIGFVVLCFLALVGAMELFFWAIRPKDKPIFSESQTQLLKRHDVPTFPEMIHEVIDENEADVLLLGGTFKTFTDDEDNLSSLKKFSEKHQNKVQILIMDPKGEGLKAAANARQQKKPDVSSRTLYAEVRASLIRFAEVLGNDWCSRNIYFYRTYPTHSLFKVKDNWIITPYTFGRGASSPALYFKESDATKGFCKKLEDSFDDMRDKSEQRRRDDFVPPEDDLSFLSNPGSKDGQTGSAP